MAKGKRNVRDQGLEIIAEVERQTEEEDRCDDRSDETRVNLDVPEPSHVQTRSRQRAITDQVDLADRVDRLEELLTRFIESQMNARPQVQQPSDRGEPSHVKGEQEAVPRVPSQDLDQDIPHDDRPHSGSAKTIEKMLDGENERMNQPTPDQEIHDQRRRHIGRQDNNANLEDRSEGDLQDLTRKIKMMNRRIDEMARGSKQNEETGLTTQHLFTADIMAEPLPLGFQIPPLETYDGTDDPVDHMQNYNCSMTLHGFPRDSPVGSSYPL